ncbi:MAG: hypothetical protein FJZ60_02450 [Chlamydiae bacterium]|nr:hypothetical protein [Chlamydiota bacterium]
MKKTNDSGVLDKDKLYHKIIADFVDSGKPNMQTLAEMGANPSLFFKYIDDLRAMGTPSERLMATRFMTLMLDQIEEIADQLENEHNVPRGMFYLKLIHPEPLKSKKEAMMLMQELEDTLQNIDKKLSKAKKKPKKFRNYL